MLGWSGRDIRDSVGTTGNGALAATAVPDADSLPADGDLAAEGAGVLGVLGDLHLLHLLTQGGTVTVHDPTVSPGVPSECARPRSSVVSIGNSRAQG